MMNWNDDSVLRAFESCHAKHRLFAPSKNHRCGNLCRFWKFTPPAKNTAAKVMYGKAPAYVCINHKCVHRCGEECSRAVVNVEGSVCELTGMFLGTHHVHHSSLKTDFWGHRVRSTHRHVERRRKAETNIDAKLREWTAKAVRTLFSSPGRIAAYGHRISKLHQILKSSLRRGEPFTVANIKLLTYVRQNQTAFNPPSVDSDKRLEALVCSISAYARKFKKLRLNPKNVFAFVAACVECLRSGVVIQNVVMFPRLEFVSQHAPEELQHGLLGKMKCRYVTAARQIIANEITSSAGVPIKSMAYQPTVIDWM